MSAPVPPNTEWTPLTPGSTMTQSLYNNLSALSDAAVAAAAAASASQIAAAASAAAALTSQNTASAAAVAAIAAQLAAEAAQAAAELAAGTVDLNNLNANNLTSGTVPDARFPATLPAVSGANLTALNASVLASGTIPDARFPATLPAADGQNLTNLTGSALDGKTLKPRLQAYDEVLAALGNKTGAFDVDYDDGNVQSLTLTGNSTATIINPPATGRSARVTLIVTGNGTATFAITGANYMSQGAPSDPIANTERRVYNCVSIDGGTEWLITYLDES